jgi:hypothetical protein
VLNRELDIGVQISALTILVRDGEVCVHHCPGIWSSVGRQYGQAFLEAFDRHVQIRPSIPRRIAAVGVGFCCQDLGIFDWWIWDWQKSLTSLKQLERCMHAICLAQIPALLDREREEKRGVKLGFRNAQTPSESLSASSGRLSSVVIPKVEVSL